MTFRLLTLNFSVVKCRLIGPFLFYDNAFACTTKWLMQSGNNTTDISKTHNPSIGDILKAKFEINLLVSFLFQQVAPMPYSLCVRGVTGTSMSCPVVSGAIALCLQAK